MKTGIVCVLDALATKGVWSVEETNIYIRKLHSIHKLLNEFKTYAKAQGKIMSLDFMTFSDTIIITIHMNGEPHPFMIPHFARSIDGVFDNCFAEGLLMRGAMSYGKFVKRKNIIVGPAIDDSAYWHDKAQLIGCVLTPNTSLLYDVGLDYLKHHGKDDYDVSQHVIKYKTPFKDGKFHELYNINWPLSTYKAIASVETRTPVFSLMELLGSNPIPADAYGKHINTIDFYNYSISEARSKRYIK